MEIRVYIKVNCQVKSEWFKIDLDILFTKNYNRY